MEREREKHFFRPCPEIMFNTYGHGNMCIDVILNILEKHKGSRGKYVRDISV